MTFDVDWNSEQEVLAWINKARAQVSVLRAKNPGYLSRARTKKRSILEACLTILATDISSLYSEHDTEKKYYVYAHLDTSKNISVENSGMMAFAGVLGLDYFPFYIGKGTGTRADELDRAGPHRKIVQKLKFLGKSVKVSRIREHLTESEAFQLEAKLIDIFGLVSHGGQLVNLDEGTKANLRRKLYWEAFKKLRGINIPLLMAS